MELNELHNIGLSVRTYNCLMRAGVTELSQLSKWTKADLMRVRNLGERCIKEILEACHKNGVYLKDELNHDDGSGLLPCPFCGRENVFIHKNEYSGTYYIRCADCQTMFKMDCTAGHDYDKQRLKDTWNRRARI